MDKEGVTASQPAQDVPTTESNTRVSFGVDHEAVVHTDHVLLDNLRLGYRIADREEMRKKAG
jgi:hypothetical protein